MGPESTLSKGNLASYMTMGRDCLILLKGGQEIFSYNNIVHLYALVQVVFFQPYFFYKLDIFLSFKAY